MVGRSVALETACVPPAPPVANWHQHRLSGQPVVLDQHPGSKNLGPDQNSVPGLKRLFCMPIAPAPI